MLGQKRVGAIDQDAAELEGLRGKPQHAVPGLQHRPPHVVERVGKQRQRTHVLDRILRGALRDELDEPIALETRSQQLRRPAHHLAKFGLTQRRDVDLQPRPEQRGVVLQGPIEIGAHAQHRAQARVGQRLRQELGKAPPIAFASARVELLALIDIEQESRRLRLIELRAAPFSGLDQIGEHSLALQRLDPAALPLDALRIGRLELPGVEKAIDERLERLGAGLERQKAPLTAALEGRRPGLGGARLGGPGLPPERRQNAGLGDRGLADAGIADQHRQPALNLERIERLDRFPGPAEEIVAVLLLHRFKTAVGRRVTP